jgi:hypothetical protein
MKQLMLESEAIVHSKNVLKVTQEVVELLDQPDKTSTDVQARIQILQNGHAGRNTVESTSGLHTDVAKRPSRTVPLTCH